jgi:hypothetical protein
MVVFMLGDGSTKHDLLGLDIVAAVEVVVDHELQEILEMGLIRLELLRHDQPLLKEVGQSGHDERVEHIDFEIEAVANMEAVKGNALYEGDSSDESGLLPAGIPAVAYAQGMVYGRMEATYVLAHCGDCKYIL